MHKYFLPACLFFVSCHILAEDKPWTIYSNIDLFAYSEPVPIDEFARDFDDTLKSGNTGFTHDIIKAGVQWRNYRIGYVHRFDYITQFTEDTAFIHHSEKNGRFIPQDRDYNVLLDVERIEARGFSVGVSWEFFKRLQVDVDATYYSDLSELQSGKAVTLGDLEPFTDQLKADADAIVANLSVDSRDLSPLLALVAQIDADLLIDYAYDQPKFREKNFRKPNFTGPQNPIISGVDFSEPDGTGYSVDVGFNWQVNDQLNLDLRLIDIANQFSWDDAPQTLASFDLNAFLTDVVAVAQDFVNGAVVRPNDLVDRNLAVDIFNADYDQELPWRANFSASYDLNHELDIFGWTPSLAVLGGYYHTDTQDFPRIGVSLDRALKIEYDFAGEAVSISYEGKYGFVRLVTDSFRYEDAFEFGVVAGLKYNF